ncbi:MAG TPA: TIGR03435 family protein [Vicinamibacterales bacterium]|jgi:uncharacterized protein (TIGR03435 family)
MTPIDVVGWTLVHFLWEGTAIGAATVVILWCLRSRSPQARYVAACTALVAMLMAPLLTAFVLSRPDVPSAPSVSVSGFATRSPVATPRADSLPAGSATAGTSDAPGNADVRSWRAMVVAVWVFGVTILLARFAAGWWSVHRLRRAVLLEPESQCLPAAVHLSSALGLRRAFHVVDSIEISTPTVIGWLRPIVVLPIAALATLTPMQVEAILAHELAHIRRHDSLVNLVQILAETLLFYHPAVWWISARIRLERECCCDVIAASTCADVVTYAEALLALERWRADLPSLALAATRGPLLARIRRLLGVPGVDDHRSTTGIMLAGMVMIFVTLAGASIYLRAAQADPPLAAVGPDDAAPWHIVFSHDDSQMRFIGFGGRDLVRFAYQVPAARVIGGPSWMDEEILRLVVSLDAAPRADEMPDVVRRVLEDKLHLKTHVEQRDFPVLALERSHSDGTLGPNLQPSALDCFDVAEWVANGQPPRALPPVAPRQTVCGEEAHDTPIGHHSYVAITMQQLADELRHVDSWMTRPGRRTLDIVDRTGLTGRYDIAFESFVPAAALMARYPMLTNVFEPLGFAPLPRALDEQLGLRLEKSEAPFDVIIIDSVERPQP